METILVPISPGELLDKLTILQIKSERMDDEAKLANVRHERDLLMETWSSLGISDAKIDELWSDLKGVNEALWDIEDEIRDKERERAFDDRFIELARAVYFTNDKRSELKKRINVHLGSKIVEEKSYQDYS
ncbi:MAG: DUF6165 family protein [Xanthomonadales bacterium]|nr:DUF6165 family protein [Xanthomonadales bacterium]